MQYSAISGHIDGGLTTALAPLPVKLPWRILPTFINEMDLSALHQRAWTAVIPLLSGAVIYADDATISVLKWTIKGGLASLLAAGARNIKVLGQHVDDENDGHIRYCSHCSIYPYVNQSSYPSKQPARHPETGLPLKLAHRAFRRTNTRHHITTSLHRMSHSDCPT